jgi:ABC-type phosphate/phosphonate transport system substrate-binding protein
MWRAVGSVCAALTLALLGACSDGAARAYAPRFTEESGSAKAEYRFAVHPLHSPQLLYETYAPLIDYLNANSPGVTFRLVASRDYVSFENRLAAGGFDFALPNPYQALQARSAGYRIFGKMAEDDRVRGLIVTRKGAPIRTLRDLEGKRIAYPAPTALVSGMMPRYFLQTHGVALDRTLTRYVGSPESVLRNVEVGASDAGGSSVQLWEAYARQHPGSANRLEVRWRTPALVNNPLVVHRSVPSGVAAHVAALLFALDETAPGRDILARMSTSGFVAADDRAYAPVEAFLRDYERELGPAGTAGAAS